MTRSRQSQTARIRIPRPRVLFFYLFLFFLFAMLLRNAEVAVESMRTGLLLCARSAIPSLFPFMVLSELLVESGLGLVLGKTLGKPLSRLLSLPPEGCCALLLGLVCGFPVGARSALSLYDSGALSKPQLENLLCFCNIPSSAFLVSAVGFSLYGNRRFGVLLYGACIASSILIGLVLRSKAKGEPCDLPTSSPPQNFSVSTFTNAVSSATGAMLSVCAYILFFSSVIGCVSHALAPLDLPEAARALLYGMLEMTSGTAAASAVPNETASALLCAFLVGFGGLSVHCQLLSFCEGRRLSFRPYFLAKLAQGVLCAATVAPFLALSPELIKKGESVSAFSYTYFSEKFTGITLACFVACVLALILSLCRRARKRS